MPDDAIGPNLGALVTEALARLRAQRADTGQESPAAVEIRETITLRKYDHTPDVPVLVETLVISESSRTVSLTEE